jgi:hypothetical protein
MQNMIPLDKLYTYTNILLDKFDCTSHLHFGVMPVRMGWPIQQGTHTSPM